MIYIPDDWIRNKKNEPEIRELISKCVTCLRFYDPMDEVEKRLKELGEDIILQELKKGTFSM